jgi:hypothetical protein
MTGFWQVSGRNQLTFEDRVKVEAWYVRNWTPWLDGIILAKTFKVVLFPENGLHSEDPASIDSVAADKSTLQSLSSALSRKPVKSKRHTAGA